MNCLVILHSNNRLRTCLFPMTFSINGPLLRVCRSACSLVLPFPVSREVQSGLRKSTRFFEKIGFTTNYIDVIGFQLAIESTKLLKNWVFFFYRLHQPFISCFWHATSAIFTKHRLHGKGYRGVFLALNNFFFRFKRSCNSN